jgi:hypothetical protein
MYKLIVFLSLSSVFALNASEQKVDPAYGQIITNIRPIVHSDVEEAALEQPAAVYKFTPILLLR